MMIKLPRFSEQGLQFLSLCIHIESLEDGASIGPGSHRTAIVTQRKEPDVIVYRIIDVEENLCHLHFDIGLDGAIFWCKEIEGKKSEVLTIPSQVLNSEQAVTIRGRYQVERSRLPEDGMVAALTGVSSRKGGYAFTLIGGLLEIEGDGPFKDIKWWPSNKESIFVELSAFQTLALNDDILVLAKETLKEGLEYILFGKRQKKGSG